MRSAVLPSFWREFRRLDSKVRSHAQKAFRLWQEDPFHPSLRFKCIHRAENIWSVRVSLGYWALGILDEDTVTWFWIGGHDQYERFFGS